MFRSKLHCFYQKCFPIAYYFFALSKIGNANAPHLFTIRVFNLFDSSNEWIHIVISNNVFCK